MTEPIPDDTEVVDIDDDPTDDDDYDVGGPDEVNDDELPEADAEPNDDDFDVPAEDEEGVSDGPEEVGASEDAEPVEDPDGEPVG